MDCRPSVFVIRNLIIFQLTSAATCTPVLVTYEVRCSIRRLEMHDDLWPTPVYPVCHLRPPNRKQRRARGYTAGRKFRSTCNLCISGTWKRSILIDRDTKRNVHRVAQFFFRYARNIEFEKLGFRRCNFSLGRAGRSVSLTGGFERYCVAMTFRGIFPFVERYFCKRSRFDARKSLQATDSLDFQRS